MSERFATAGMRVYRHSGIVPARAWAAGILFAVGMGGVCGAGFGALEILDHAIATEKFAFTTIFLGTIFGGLWLGIGLGTVLVRCKARSMTAAGLLGLLAAAVGLYAAWMSYLWLYFHVVLAPPQAVRFVLPADLWQTIWALDAAWVWHQPPVNAFSRNMLAACWAMESFIVLYTAVSGARSAVGKNVFCEKCLAWGEKRPLMQVACADFGKLAERLRAGDLELLANASPKAPYANVWGEVYLEGCGTCDELQTVTVVRSELVATKKGQSVKSRKVVERLCLMPEQTVRLALAAAAMKGGS